MIALIAIVGGLVAFAIISIRFLVAPVAAVLEPDGPTKAMRRSWHLTGDNAWRTFGLVAAVSISASIAPRAIPRTTVATQLTNVLVMGTAYRGPGRRGGG